MTADATRGATERFSGEQIQSMVHDFYARVQTDDLLGPVFGERIEDWPPHLERMILFWRAVLRSEHNYTLSPRGNPLMLHRAIPEITRPHFERWLALFGDVVDGIYEPGAAADVKRAAAGIAANLSRHLPHCVDPHGPGAGGA